MTPSSSHWLPWAAALVVLSGCAGSVSSPAPKAGTSEVSAPTGEIIELHFAWPVGLTAQVEFQESREANAPPGMESIVFRSRHRMRVEPAEEGIRVVHDQFSLEPATSAEGAKSPSGSSPRDSLETEPDAQVGDLLPDFIVDHTGKLLRIAGTDRLRADALERMASGTEESAESRARLERYIAHAISDVELTQRAARDWNALVSFWVGARLAAGVTSSPGTGGGANATGSGQVTVTPRVPCDPGDHSATCVRIELESRPSPELRNTVLLVTEPDRLVPHELRVGNEIHARMTRPDGKSEDIEQHHSWSYRFRYSSEL